MTERIIELTKAGFKISFEVDCGSGFALQIDVSRNARKMRQIIHFDHLKQACLPAETIIMCSIEKMVNEINEYLQTEQSRMLMDFGI